MSITEEVYSPGEIQGQGVLDISLVLSPEDIKLLQAVADYQGKDVSDVVSLALRIYLRRFSSL